MTKKLTIEDMHTLAAEKGGECLSTEYINNQEKIRWRCGICNHEWESRTGNVKYLGNWCPECAKKRVADKQRLSINDMHVLAAKHGGQCLSTKYINAKTKLKWRCAEGHEWEAQPSNVKTGHWCPYCVGRYKTIKDMQNLAFKRNGECLSDKYINDTTKLQWKCSEGHIWEAIPGSIKQGTWCPKCGTKQSVDKQRLTIQDMHILAKKHNGECLSEDYVNSETKLKWRCSKGHEWEAVPNSIRNGGTWCSVCARKASIKRLRQRQLLIEDLYAVAEKRGGKCLSPEYVDSKAKYFWECSEGHIWQADLNHVKYGTWCPTCSSGIAERICRVVFETVFKKRFPSKRPFWLLNLLTGRCLELDGFNEKLKIAFEYQGKQHFEPIYGEQNLERTQANDREKRNRCEENGITLVEILPFTCKYTDKTKILNHIKKACKKADVDFPKNIEPSDIDLSQAYASGKLKEMQEIAVERGGECLSDDYINANTKLKWRCSEGHEWEAIPDSVKRGAWCSKCGAKRAAMKTKKNIEDMQTLASKHGGVCLSTEYINTATKLWWQCSEGHEWEAAPSSVQQGHWCPQCANKRIGEDLRYSIENMQDLAIKRGGMCLSFEYIDNKTKLRWQCGFCGHKWEARPANIKKGNWCPTCGRKKSDLARRRYSIGDMHDLAVRKNGKCLSPEYLGAHAKLKWRCSKGHEWEARPNAIRRGNWCPTCSGKRKKTIDAMQEVARDRGGECLSAQYTNCKNKLQWRCAKGHEWEATPDNIVQGKWCPYCAGKRKPVQSEKQIHNQQAKQLCLF